MWGKIMTDTKEQICKCGHSKLHHGSLPLKNKGVLTSKEYKICDVKYCNCNKFEPQTIGCKLCGDEKIYSDFLKKAEDKLREMGANTN